MATEITDEQRRDAELQALASDGPWLSEAGLTSFEHEKVGAMGVISALTMVLLTGLPITAELLLHMAESLDGASEEAVHGEIPVEGPFEE